MDIWLNRQAGVDTAPLLFHGLGTTRCPIEDAIAADPFLGFLGEDPQVRRGCWCPSRVIYMPALHCFPGHSHSLTSARAGVSHVPSHVKRYPASRAPQCHGSEQCA